MELEIEVNPDGAEDEYLAGLNRSFGQWGDRSQYRWDFEREVGAHSADLMVLRDQGKIVAGSAVSYRIVRDRGDELLVGIMTGSWTLPEARGRGAFSRVIDESRKLVASRKGSLLIAFVTQDNPSRRRLVAAGCLEVPTWYVASNSDTVPPVHAPAVQPDSATPEELFSAYRRWQDAGTGACMVYPSIEVWTSQYLDRPLPVERVTVAGCHCLIERAAGSDRVLWIGDRDPLEAVRALVARAVTAGRQLFVFVTQAELAQAGVALGMVAKPGSITVLSGRDEPANDASPRTAGLPLEWRLQGGDRA